MREEKWCILEQFRVLSAWRGRVLREAPEVFESLIRRHLAMMESGAQALGPFLVESAEGDEDVGWLSIAWQFTDEEAAAELLALWREPQWRDYLEVRFQQGYKYEPVGGLPGF